MLTCSTKSLHNYVESLEVRGSVIDHVYFQVVFQQVQVILHPFLTLGFQLLKRVEFYLIFTGRNVLRLNIVLIAEFLEPQR